MIRKPPIFWRRQQGQAFVMIALMILVIIGAVGLAVDGGIAYYYNASAERAAAAAALSGVVFMPYEFTPSQAVPGASGNDSTDRAMVAARRNGFNTTSAINCTATTCTATGPNGVTVTTSALAGLDNKLQVTVSRTVNSFFMSFFGVGTYNVSRTAIATYLPPIKLGQSGGSIGSTVSQLGTGGSNYYFLRSEGWATDRGQGDAYTPNGTCGTSPECPSNDVHQLSAFAGTDTADATLPAEGGYNFMVNVPAGQTAQIQIYNAAFAPDSNNGSSTPNFCENWNTGFAGRACNANTFYWMHEDDCCGFSFGTANTYSAMKYTIFNAPSTFIRNTDTVLSQILVKPVDASCYPTAGCAQVGYTDVNTGKTIQQKFSAIDGHPTNMLAYHAWMNVGGYSPDATCVGACAAGFEAESQLIKYTPGKGPIGALAAGQYRLRVDTLEYNGSNPCSTYPTTCTGTSAAHKGFAVRVMNGAGTASCATCTISALDDMALFTPINVGSGASFPIQIFQLPPDYAGQLISFDTYDVGDMTGNTGQIYLAPIDPTTGSPVVEPAGGASATVSDCGPQRSNFPASCTVVGTYANPSGVEQLVTNGSTFLGNNKWYHYDIPIPSTYAPGGNPNNWWWNLRYRTTAGVQANDTITVTVNLKGNPAHLVQS